MSTIFAPIAEMVGQPVGEGVTINSTISSEGKVIGVVNGTWQWLPKLSRAEFYKLLDPFIKLLEKERNDRAKAQYPRLHDKAVESGMRGYEEVGYDEGDRFVKVWCSDVKDHSSRRVCYFVEKDTGIIFGAKGWKAFNPNNEYGTLHTISEWTWSDYYGVSKKGIKTLTPKKLRRK